MSSFITVKPVPGRKVRLPESGDIMPEKGLDVRRNAYWQRRIDDGDVVEQTPQASKKGKE